MLNARKAAFLKSPPQERYSTHLAFSQSGLQLKPALWMVADRAHYSTPPVSGNRFAPGVRPI
jgi:hypothetical protein